MLWLVASIYRSRGGLGGLGPGGAQVGQGRAVRSGKGTPPWQTPDFRIFGPTTRGLGKVLRGFSVA